MSAGLVPILYKFNNGIKRIVTDDVGYIVDVNDIDKVVSIIKDLNGNRELLNIKSKNAVLSAKTNFNVKDRAKDYYDFFKRFEEFKREKSKINCPAPDISEHPVIPFAVINVYRKISRKITLMRNRLLPKDN
jgi:hypothetical protein